MGLNTSTGRYCAVAKNHMRYARRWSPRLGWGSPSIDGCDIGNASGWPALRIACEVGETRGTCTSKFDIKCPQAPKNDAFDLQIGPASCPFLFVIIRCLQSLIVAGSRNCDLDCFRPILRRRGLFLHRGGAGYLAPPRWSSSP